MKFPFLSAFKKSTNKEDKDKKVKSDESFCHCKALVREKENLIIFVSMSEDYYSTCLAELLDAANNSSMLMNTKLVLSSYDEETDEVDEDGYKIWIINNRYYLLIGGSPEEWEHFFFEVDISNKMLSYMIEEINSTYSSPKFNELYQDHILEDRQHYDYEEMMQHDNFYYTDPLKLLSNLPKEFRGRDLMKFIRISEDDTTSMYLYEYCCFLMDYKNMDISKYPVYEVLKKLLKNPTNEYIRSLSLPLYKQPDDDDSIVGDIDDASLHEIFREKYERFSAVSDDSIYYEDIDEQIDDDAESDNMKDSDKVVL